MATTVSKLEGTLSIGTTPTPIHLEAQISEIGTPQTVTRDSAVTVLTGDVIQAQATYSWELAGTFLMDWADPAGAYYSLWNVQGTEQPFTFTPIGATGPTYAGVCIIDGFDTPVQKAGSLAQSSFKWPVQGRPTMTPPTGTTAREARAK